MGYIYRIYLLDTYKRNNKTFTRNIVIFLAYYTEDSLLVNIKVTCPYLAVTVEHSTKTSR